MCYKKLFCSLLFLNIIFFGEFVFADDSLDHVSKKNLDIEVNNNTGTGNAHKSENINRLGAGISLMDDTVAKVVEKTLPAVVTLSVSKKVRVPVSPFSGIESFFFGNIFDSFNDIMSNYGEYRENIAFSSGTGFLISDSGYILTNYHNIESAVSVSVVLSDNRQFNAQVVGVDAATDLAVVKIETAGELMPYLNFSDTQPRAGEWVISIGNRLSLGNSVSLGVISSVMSCPFSGIAGVNYLGEVIQTDAIMASGSSGGALIDTNGRVVGVNFAAISSGANSVGVSYFAIPASIAENVSSILKNGGEIKRGYIGIICQDVTSEIASALGLEKVQGTIVSDILDGSPAQKAGLKVGDIIVRFDEKYILDNRDLASVVSNSSIEKPIKIVVKRSVDGRNDLTEHTLKIFIGTADEKKKLDNNNAFNKNRGTKEKDDNVNTKLTIGELGVDIIELDQYVRRNLKLDEAIKGVLVVNVHHSHENVKSILKGDIVKQVITKTQKFDIVDKESLIKSIDTIKESKVTHVILSVMRGKQNLFLGVNATDVASLVKKQA